MDCDVVRDGFGGTFEERSFLEKKPMMMRESRVM